MKKESPIGFFDSGVGGLSVYAQFKKILPFENTIYFGDLKNMPYGSKSKDELISFAKKILDFYKEKDAKAVVIACNTSSAVAYDVIKGDYDFKIYPIIQSCSKVIAQMGASKIGVFATPATINSGAYKREINKYNSNINVYEIACPKWTEYVEHSLINSDECINDVESKIKEMTVYNPEKIVLGCTHYPYLLNVLTKFLSADIFIDPASIFVDYIKSDLGNLLNNSSEVGKEQFYVSANPDSFVKNAELFYEVKSELVSIY